MAAKFGGQLANQAQRFVGRAPTQAQRFVGLRAVPTKSASIKTLLSDTEGCLEQLLLFVPAYEARDFEAIYTSLIKQLPAHTGVVVLTVPEAVGRVKQWAKFRPSATFKIIDAALNITPWARDPHWVASENNQVTLYSSPSLQRRDDPAAVAALAENLRLRHHCFPAPFEGGNSLITGDRLFVGSDTLLTQQGREVATKQANLVQALLQSGFGHLELIVLGDATKTLPKQRESELSMGGQAWQEISYYSNTENTTQPIFHLDHYVTPLPDTESGLPRVMVGDSRLAANLLGQKLHPTSQADEFDAIANQLEELGYQVIRNPLPLIYMDEPEAKKRVWFYTSSNNVLQQASATHGNIVWLPQYGHDNWPELQITDQANAKLWQDIGYEVRFIPDCQRLAENLGGLHCMTSVLKRA